MLNPTARALRHLWRDGLLAALVTAGVTAIVSFAPAPEANRFDGDSHNFAHVLIFGVVGLVLSRLLRRMTPRQPGRLAVTVVSLVAGLVFGAFTEYAQGFLGGIPSWGDVARDMLGCAVGSCVAFALEPVATAATMPPTTPATTPTTRRLLWLAAVLGIVIGAEPLVNTILDYRARNTQFPVLLDPNVPRSLSFTSSFGEPVFIEPLPQGLALLDTSPVSAAPASRLPPHEGLAIRVPLERGPWPGVTLEEPAPDWRGWRAWVVELANPNDQPLKLYVRVNDRVHDNSYEDRFDTAVELPPRSRRRFEFPIADIERAPRGRRMNLTQIEKLIVFHGGPAPGQHFYLERLSLAR